MNSNRDDPHAVLGVGRTATPAQIGHAYRELLRRHHPDTRTPDDDKAHDLALREVLNAYADLHHRARRDASNRDQPTRHARQTEDTQTQPIVVLGHLDPPTTAAPTWIVPHGNEAARPAAINLLIAFLEALSSEH